LLVLLAFPAGVLAQTSPLAPPVPDTKNVLPPAKPGTGGIDCSKPGNKANPQCSEDPGIKRAPAHNGDPAIVRTPPATGDAINGMKNDATSDGKK
jgi:hypothetical protein